MKICKKIFANLCWELCFSCIFTLYCSLSGEKEAWIMMPTSSHSVALLTCMLVSACFLTPRLKHGHQGSFKSMHDLKYMRTQTRPRFYVSSEGCGATLMSIKQIHTCAALARDWTWGDGMGGQCANYYTMVAVENLFEGSSVWMITIPPVM